MPKATNKPYGAAGSGEPFSFSDYHRERLQNWAGLSEQCISKIETAVNWEKTFSEINPDRRDPKIRNSLDRGAEATANLLKWLAEIDAKTKVVIESTSRWGTHKHLSDYLPAMKELTDSIEYAKSYLLAKKRGRPAGSRPALLAGIIAEVIKRHGHSVDARPNGPLCCTLGVVLDAIGIRRSKVSGIVSKVLNEHGN